MACRELVASITTESKLNPLKADHEALARGDANTVANLEQGITSVEVEMVDVHQENAIVRVDLRGIGTKVGRKGDNLEEPTKVGDTIIVRHLQERCEGDNLEVMEEAPSEALLQVPGEEEESS